MSAGRSIVLFRGKQTASLGEIGTEMKLVGIATLVALTFVIGSPATVEASVFASNNTTTIVSVSGSIGTLAE